MGFTSSDAVHHFGCGGSGTVTIAAEEFNVKKSVGIKTKKEGKPETRRIIENTNKTEIIIGDIRKISISDVTVLFFLLPNPGMSGIILTLMIVKSKSLKS